MQDMFPSLLQNVFHSLMQKTFPSLLQDMFPALLRKTYAEARRSFDNAVLCGVLDTKTGQAQLNPPDDCLLDTHHRLVFLSSTADVTPSKQVTACSCTRTTMDPQKRLYAKSCCRL